MAVDNFIPALWSSQILKTLRNELVFGGLVNRRYEGEVKKGGSVTIFSVGEISIKDMPSSRTSDKKGTPRKIDAAEGIGVTSVTLNIDKEKYFNVGIDDVDAVQRNADLFPEYIESATYGLRSAMDKEIIAKMTGETQANKIGNAGSEIQLTPQNIYAEILKMKVMLDRANAPQTGRYLVMPPEAEGILLRDNRFIYVGTGGNALSNGRLFRACGFEIAISNDIEVQSDNKTKIIAFHKESTAFVEQLMKIESYRIQEAFSDAIKGLSVFGCKVIRPKHIVIGHVKVGEPASDAS